MLNHLRTAALRFVERYQKELVILSAVVAIGFLIDKFLFLTTDNLISFKLEFFGLWIFTLWLFRAKASASYWFGLLLFWLSLPFIFWNQKFIANQLCLLAFILWGMGFWQDIFEVLLQGGERTA